MSCWLLGSDIYCDKIRETPVFNRLSHVFETLLDLKEFEVWNLSIG